MYRIDIHGFDKPNLLAELIDEFMTPSEYSFSEGGTAIDIESAACGTTDDAKREIYDKLKETTGKAPEWGILTGVRPVKLFGELYRKTGSIAGAKEFLAGEYRLSVGKADLLSDIYLYQTEICGEPPVDSVSLYVGIPFCPTRCLYCSFASNQVGEDEIARYLEALKREIREVGEMSKRAGQEIETLYFGGGTPTTLSARQLSELLELTAYSFDLSKVREITVEAGRPDTISADKLRALKDHGVTRISINPQSMKQETLDIIGRSHTPDDIRMAFEEAMQAGFDSVNSDVIAGLPKEDENDCMAAIDAVTGFGADNVTVHSLAVKRASRLKEQDPEYHYRYSELVKKTISLAGERLKNKGFKPYYLYRQKHMSGAAENTGYCKDDKAGLYNVRIMDEHQSILALGAGGVSKRYYPSMNRLTRVPNVTNYTQYIDRVDEMIKRKYEGFFKGEGEIDAD
ncbi:MAG: coproporphyrinogen dehydrogenase HemZ [Eubacterium sp.]